jgi:hypothetical protein
MPLVQTTLLALMAGGWPLRPARAGEARLNGLLVDAARVPESVSYRPGSAVLLATCRVARTILERAERGPSRPNTLKAGA